LIERKRSFSARVRHTGQIAAATAKRGPYAILLALLFWAAFGCSNSTGPTSFALGPYHYAAVGSNRYYEEVRVIDTGATVDTVVDTLVDSLWRVYTDADGVLWAQSILKAASVVAAQGGRQDLAASAAAVTRRVGWLADTIFVDPTLRDKVLEGPLVANRTWFVRTDGTISARLIGQETVDLGIGPTLAWHVNMGAVADEWWAIGLGRVRYEEFDSDGLRVQGTLLGIGSP
jgi:hypothetical protein